MKALGIDPGTHRIGWAIIEGDSLNQKALEYGCIELPKGTGSAKYLKTIYSSLKKLVKKHKPDKAGVEKLFFHKNRKTAMQVAQARGVVLFALAESGVIYQEISPNTIKSAVAGYGNADKKQVEKMVALQLDLDETPRLDDTSDALATAITTLTIRDDLSKLEEK